LGTSFRSLPLRSRRGLLLIRLARHPCLASRYLPLTVVVGVIVIDRWVHSTHSPPLLRCSQENYCRDFVGGSEDHCLEKSDWSRCRNPLDL